MTSWTPDDSELFNTYGEAFVPRRREQFAMLCALIDPLPTPSVLELGCGTGLLTAEILRAYPAAVVTAIDSSETMLAEASRRLAPFGDRSDLRTVDLLDRAWRTGTYGAVVTSLAVHHLDDVQKRDLIQAVYDRLAPGGVFAQADLTRPATPRITTLAAATWDASVGDQSIELFGDDEALDAFRRSRWNTFHFPDPVDRPATLVHTIGWLHEAGFVGIDVPWAFAGHTVLSAMRPRVPGGGADSA
ncbi:methyltransferase domain-containing protein [Nocardia salmonicida]|uniref:methyltransferase domain-containing protein n=1 Tax=Nocardia salmonicida TaxID=53431 RepID=UPI0033D73E5C